MHSVIVLTNFTIFSKRDQHVTEVIYQSSHHSSAAKLKLVLDVLYISLLFSAVLFPSLFTVSHMIFSSLPSSSLPFRPLLYSLPFISRPFHFSFCPLPCFSVHPVLLSSILLTLLLFYPFVLHSFPSLPFHPTHSHASLPHPSPPPIAPGMWPWVESRDHPSIRAPSRTGDMAMGVVLGPLEAAIFGILIVFSKTGIAHPRLLAVAMGGVKRYL